MENKIKMINEFFDSDIEEDKTLSVPYSVIQHWRDEIGFDPEHAADLITDFLEMNMAQDDEVQPVEDKAIEEIDELSSDDENPNFIKKFEDI